MAMHSHKRRSSAQRIALVWAFVLIVAAWGIWSAMALHHTLRGAPHGQSRLLAARPMLWVETAEAQLPDDPFKAGPMPDEDAVQNQRPLLSREEIAALFDSGARALEAGKISAGRDLLNQALAGGPDELQGEALRRRLSALNTGIFLGQDVPQNDPYVRLGAIARGDSLVRLGRQYKVPAELLTALNPQLNPRNLPLGAGIKLVYGPFHVRVEKRAGRLDLFARDMYVQSFPVGFDEGNYLAPGLYHVARGGKIALGGAGPADRRWVMCEGVADRDGGAAAACLYGSAGPRPTGRIGLSGVRCSDEVLRRVYNTLIEQDSLLRVDP